MRNWILEPHLDCRVPVRVKSFLFFRTLRKWRDSSLHRNNNKHLCSQRTPVPTETTGSITTQWRILVWQIEYTHIYRPKNMRECLSASSCWRQNHHPRRDGRSQTLAWGVWGGGGTETRGGGWVCFNMQVACADGQRHSKFSLNVLPPNKKIKYCCFNE